MRRRRRRCVYETPSIAPASAGLDRVGPAFSRVRTNVVCLPMSKRRGSRGRRNTPANSIVRRTAGFVPAGNEIVPDITYLAAFGPRWGNLDALRESYR